MSKLFISGGTVIDPETLSRFQADVLCEDGRIAAVQPAQSGAPKDARVIDASGCFVCPGFIDPHGHIDGCKYTGTLSLLQGITTTVGGNCGFSPLDIDAFLRSQTAFPIHQAEMIGLCALREAAGVTDLFAPAKRAQVHTMEALCEGYDPDEDSYYGRTYADSPDIDGKIWFTAEKHIKTGDFVDIHVLDTYDGELVGVLEEEYNDDCE